MTPEEVAAEIERMHLAEGGPPRRLPGERAMPPQGTALVGTQGPPETFGATPAEVQAVRAAIEYIAGGPKEKRQSQLTEEYAQGVGQGGFLEERPGQAPLVRPYEAFKELASPEGQYRVGAEDVEGARKGAEIASAAMVGSMPFPRPAGSIGIFLGRPQAEELARIGRPAAKEVLDMAERMEERGISHNVIRAAAHRRFKKDEPRFGTIYKTSMDPDAYIQPSSQKPRGQWVFEVATNKDRVPKVDPKKTITAASTGGLNPDVWDAMPGIEDVKVKASDFPSGYHEPGILGDPRTPSVIGLRPPHIGGRTGADVKYDWIRELQNEVGWQTQTLPRGGMPGEFGPGGRFEHMRQRRADGTLEEPRQAYERLLGTMLAKLAAERGNMSPTQLRKESVEQTLGRLRAQKAIPQDPMLATYYRGQRIRTHAEEEEEKARADFARRLARERVMQKRAGAMSPSTREKLAREDKLGQRAAEEAERQGIALSAGPHRWTPETSPGAYSASEKALIADLYKQGASTSDIIKALAEHSGRQSPSSAIRRYMNRELGPAPRTFANLQELWTRETNLALARLHNSAPSKPVHIMAEELSKITGKEYSAKAVGDQINRLRLGQRGRPWGLGFEAWQPDALAILKSEEAKGLNNRELASRISAQTGQVVTEYAVLGKRQRLREEQVRAELAEDLAKEKP